MQITIEQLKERWKETQVLPKWSRPYIIQGLVDASLNVPSGIGYNLDAYTYCPTKAQLAPIIEAMREILNIVEISVSEDRLYQIAADWNVGIGIMQFSAVLRVHDLIPMS